MRADFRADARLVPLLELSRRLGTDIRRTQGAGGNTSQKMDGEMWIKASGTWLAQAMERNIFVPVALAPLLEALAINDPRAEKAVAFVRDGHGGGLRPSIETSVHAVIPHAVVAHFHCVDTLAHAVRRDAAAVLVQKMADLPEIDWVLMPYCRPGIPLARAILRHQRPGTQVHVLANHGLIVSGASVEAVEALTGRVTSALALEPRLAPVHRFEPFQDDFYRLPDHGGIHSLALDPHSLRIAQERAMYPDHVIFLGGKVAALPPGCGVSRFVRTFRDRQEEPPALLLVPGKGVLQARHLSPGAEAMARCLAEVAARIPAGADIAFLSEGDEHDLTHWEAEAYRQALEKVVPAQESGLPAR